MRIGGRDTTQDFIQQRVSLRDDYTRFVQWNGAHAIKGGVVLSFLRYDVTKFQVGNPVFELRQRRELRVSLPGAVRRRQSRSQHRQPAVRLLRPGRLDRRRRGSRSTPACGGTTSRTC